MFTHGDQLKPREVYYSYNVLMGAAIASVILLVLVVIIAIGVLTSGFGIPALAGLALGISAALGGLKAAVGGIAVVGIVVGSALTIGAVFGSIIGAIRSILQTPLKQNAANVTTEIVSIHQQINALTSNYEQHLKDEILKVFKSDFREVVEYLHKQKNPQDLIGVLLDQHKNGLNIGSMDVTNRDHITYHDDREKKIGLLLTQLRIVQDINANEDDLKKDTVLKKSVFAAEIDGEKIPNRTLLTLSKNATFFTSKGKGEIFVNKIDDLLAKENELRKSTTQKNN